MDETQQYIDARKQSLPYYMAEQFAMHTNRPIFITGKAGTGKTTFLRKLREQSPKNMAVEAMIHDMLVEGKPSPFLLDFIKMVKQRRNPAPEPQQRFGERWMVEDDLRLRELFLEGTPIVQLAKEFNRT